MRLIFSLVTVSRQFSLIATLVLSLCVTSSTSSAQGTAVDLAAIERLWPILDTLRLDRDPSEGAWRTLFATPAWRTLGTFRAQRTRARLEMVFRPSQSDSLEAALALPGPDAAALRHLRAVMEREDDLRRFARALADGSAPLDVMTATRRAAAYLPVGTTDPTREATIAFAVFERDGYADDRVIVDLLYVLELGTDATRLLAHELHHVYQSRLLPPFTRPANGSSDQLLLEALFQLQREGVANLVDKWPRLQAGGEAMAGLESFRAEMQRSPAVIAALDSLLSGVSGAAAPEALRLAREIRWRALPQSGHPTGLYMAQAILAHAGRDALVATLANPFAFVRAYQRAAAAAGAPALGTPAWLVLRDLETRTFGPSVDPTESLAR